MAVANPITADARVRKTARSVAALGYEVIVVWADAALTEVVEEDFAGIRTIGLPARYYLREQALAERASRTQRRQRRPARLIGYANPDQRRTKAAELAFRTAAAAGRLPFGLKLAQLVHRGRSKALSARTDRLARRTERRLAQPDGWRGRLPELMDLEGIFTPWLVQLEPDLIHIHDIYLTGAGLLAKRALARQGRQVKLIYDAHEYVAGCPGNDPLDNRAYIAFEQAIAPRYDAVVTVSEPIADAMARHLKLAQRPVVVHNSPDPAMAQPSPNGTVRTAAGLTPDVPLLVYSGVIQPQRNVEAVVRALPALPGVRFAVVCVPNPAVPLARALLDLAGQLGVADRVHLLRPVPPEAVSSYLAGADLGIDPMSQDFPQHAYCLPNKLWDYLRAGLPVVVANNESEAALVRAEHFGVVFESDSPKQLAAAVTSVLARRDEYGAAVRASQLVEAYAWPRQMDRLAALYSRLVPLAAQDVTP
jgi:glycosyltransferase involved in cell wall biosynthesis